MAMSSAQHGSERGPLTSRHAWIRQQSRIASSSRSTASAATRTSIEVIEMVQIMRKPSDEEKVAQWRASQSRADVIQLLRALLSNMSKDPEPAPAAGSKDGSAHCRSLATASASVSKIATTAGDLWQPQSQPSSEASGPPITTLMLRGIPASCTHRELLRLWPMDGTWDLLYLPLRGSCAKARGYAFMNFTDEARAADFRRRWQGARLSPFSTGAGLDITQSSLQGFEANVQHLKSKPAGELKSRLSEPILVKHGRRVSLDEV